MVTGKTYLLNASRRAVKMNMLSITARHANKRLNDDDSLFELFQIYHNIWIKTNGSNYKNKCMNLFQWNLISKLYLVNSGTATEFATSPTIDTTISTTPSSQNVNSARSSCSSSHLDVMLFMPRDVFSIMETFSKKTENAGSTNKSNRCCCNREVREI